MPRVFSLPSSRPHLKLDVKFTVGLPTSLFSHLLDRAGPFSPLSHCTGISGIAEMSAYICSPVVSPIHPHAMKLTRGPVTHIWIHVQISLLQGAETETCMNFARLRVHDEVGS